MGIQLLPEPNQFPMETLGQERVLGLSPGRPQVGLGVEVGRGRRGLTWTKASHLLQLSKPSVRNTPSRTASVEADTSGLLSDRVTLGPCPLYLPWGGKARVGPG